MSKSASSSLSFVSHFRVVGAKGPLLRYCDGNVLVNWFLCVFVCLFFKVILLTDGLSSLIVGSSNRLLVSSESKKEAFDGKQN